MSDIEVKLELAWGSNLRKMLKHFLEELTTILSVIVDFPKPFGARYLIENDLIILKFKLYQNFICH